MEKIFENILEQIASGNIDNIYSDAVISIDKDELIWDGLNDKQGTIAVYSRNNVEVLGTAVSLHPSIIIENTTFSGNTTITYKIKSENIEIDVDYRVDGILITWNGGEKIIPLYIKSSINKDIKASENEEDNNKKSYLLDDKEESLNIKEKKLRIKLAKINIQRMLSTSYDDFKDYNESDEFLNQQQLEIQSLIHINPDCVRYRLYDGIVSAKLNDINRAERIELNIKNVILSSRKEFHMEYCLLLYMQTIILYRKNKIKDFETKRKNLLKEIHDNISIMASDFDLIIIIYDSIIGFHENRFLNLWNMFEKIYYYGCNSPFLYTAGACIIKKIGRVDIEECEFNEFMCRCLYEGIKNNIFDLDIIDLISDKRVDSTASYIRLMYEACYNIKKSKNALTSLCINLIRSGIKDDKVFKYYKKAVDENIKIVGLYDYFMDCIPEAYDEPINKEILLYYMSDDGINPLIYTHICLNVLKFYCDDKFIFDYYHEGIHEFLKNQIIRNNWSKDLALLTAEIITDEQVDSEFAKMLLPLLNLVQIKAEVPDGSYIVYESGIYKEPVRGIINNCKTCIYIYGEGIFHVEDRSGNRLNGVSLKIYPLIQEEALIKKINKLCEDNPELMLIKTYDMIYKNEYRNCDFDLCVQYAKDDSLNDNFRKKIIDYIFDYSNKFNMEISNIESFINYTNIMDINQVALYSELLIRKKYYKEAIKIIKILPFQSIRASMLLRLSENIEKNDENISLINYIQKYLWRKKLLNKDNLLQFSKIIKGTYDEYLSLYNECVEKNIDIDFILEELLLKCIVCGDDSKNNYNAVQELVIKTINIEKNVLINAAISYICYCYVVYELKLKKDIIGLVHSMIMKTGDPVDIPITCKLAFLKYSEDYGISHDIEKVVRKKVCYSVLSEGRYLDFVVRQSAEEGINVWPALQVNIAGKIDFDIKNIKESFIEYKIEGDSKIYKSKAVLNYGKIFCAQVIIFAGDKVKYRLVTNEYNSEWLDAKDWCYEINDNNEFEFDNSSYKRYDMLQNIAARIEKYSAADSDMMQYEKTLKLVSLIGK